MASALQPSPSQVKTGAGTKAREAGASRQVGKDLSHCKRLVRKIVRSQVKGRGLKGWAAVPMEVSLGTWPPITALPFSVPQFGSKHHGNDHFGKEGGKVRASYPAPPPALQLCLVLQMHPSPSSTG